MIETHTRILGIAPYDGMRTAMEQAAQAYPNVEMDIYTGDLEDGQAIVQQMPPNSYDCIISRGGTAALIRQVTDLPVVDIHISVYDVLRTMKLAENYSSLYAIVGFPSITEPAHTLCSLLDFNLDILTVNNAAEVATLWNACSRAATGWWSVTWSPTPSPGRWASTLSSSPPASKASTPPSTRP